MPLGEIINAQALDSSSDLFTTNSINQISSTLQLEEESSELSIFESDQFDKPQNSNRIETLFNYRSLIDNLVDFTPRTTSETYTYDKESTTLVLVNRVLILNDIMLHLSEKTFLKNYSLKLYELVNQIVISVSKGFNCLANIL